ncbi:MAG TPA: DUF3037 domain-containing protein [Bacteroidales bacterium]|nr:DUF3037 domain-containing protein [Bacteroidales bacterium]
MSFSRDEERILTSFVKEYFRKNPNKRHEIIQDRIFYKKLIKLGLVKQYPLQFMFRIAAKEILKEDKSSIKELSKMLELSEVSLYNYLNRGLKNNKHDKNTYYYSIVRFVPDKVAGEFVNVGMIAVSGADRLVAAKFVDDIDRIINFYNISDAGKDKIKDDIRMILKQINEYNKYDDTLGKGGYNYLCNMVYHIKKNLGTSSYAFNKIYKYSFEKKINLEEFKEAIYKKYIKEG